MRINLLILTLFLGPAVLLAQSVEWKNPEIKCEPTGKERAVKQYPLPKSKKSSGGEDRKGMKDFSDRMAKRFADSKMDSISAHKIYVILAQDGFIRDESYGMPSPDRKRKERLTADELKKRVAIKMLKSNVYEILYYRFGCGRKFSHMTIQIRDGKILQKHKNESWSGSYPC